MESIISLVVLVYLMSLGKSQMEQKAKERAQKMEMLEKALQNPNLDRATVQLLSQQLAGVKPENQRGTGLAWLLALGWLTLFSGLGVWGLGAMTGETGVQSAGVLVTLIGFGFVTYPFALRELESRRPAA